jgi:predicted aldo/keto reductase-like oxidoreductase
VRPSAAARRPFGPRGPDVSLFTLGTMRAVNGEAQMEAVLAAALACGINHLETAPAYGPAEAFLGEALRRLAVPRSQVVITSKLLPGVGAEEGRRLLGACLGRLGTCRLDNLAVHGLNGPEHLEWALRGEGAELLRWAEGEGKASQIGFSSHGSNALIEAALASGRFGFCSLHVHLFDSTRLPLARQALAHGIGVMAISPADKGGRLYDPPSALVEDCRPFHPLELAYRYLLAQGISSLSLGAAGPGDLVWAEGLANRSDPLSQSEEAALVRLQTRGEERLGAERCGQCRACLPCPQEVPIPELLRLRNLAVGHGMETFARERYNLIGRASHWWESLNASACGRCGECLPRCPHGLAIPDLLADTHHRLVEAPRRRLWG